MRPVRRFLWPVVKFSLGLLLLAFIGRRFYVDLQRPDLWDQPLHYGWLVASGVLYLVGLLFSGRYWQLLLLRLGEPAGFAAAQRAYYVGHLGKYLPGKAWALLLRVGLIRAAGVRAGPAVVTTFFEVLTTMAGGCVLAALLYGVFPRAESAPLSLQSLLDFIWFQTPGQTPGPALLVLASLGLLAITGLPLLPPVFNRLVERMSRPFLKAGEEPTRVRLVWLGDGLWRAALGWLFLGVSLIAVLLGLRGDELTWTWPAMARVTAGLAFAYVAGFVIVIAPGGLGVREYLLALLLAPELELAANVAPESARALAIVGVLVLRVVWTVAEVVAAALLYWTPVTKSDG